MRASSGNDQQPNPRILELENEPTQVRRRLAAADSSLVGLRTLESQHTHLGTQVAELMLFRDRALTLETELGSVQAQLA